MKPRAWVEQHASSLPPGRALDLACGDGRNAVWLAERGWSVTAVDRSPGFSHPAVDIRVADLERHEFVIQPDAWDLIVMSYYLQRDLFPALVRGLRPGGTAIAIVHLFEPGHEASRFSFGAGELRASFPDAQVMHYSEGKPSASSRAVAQIVIRR